jgi:polyhydroxyalkanoate synthase subunit PhaC
MVEKGHGLENLLADLDRGEGRPSKFVLAASGHMAGVISAPGSKYGHWTNDELASTPDEWLDGTKTHQGSWWPLWDEWVTPFNLGRVLPRSPGGGKLGAVEDAPGTYVRVRSDG